MLTATKKHLSRVKDSVYKNVILSRKVKEDFAREIMFEWGVWGKWHFQQR